MSEVPARVLQHAEAVSWLAVLVKVPVQVTVPGDAAIIQWESWGRGHLLLLIQDCRMPQPPLPPKSYNLESMMINDPFPHKLE